MRHCVTRLLRSQVGGAASRPGARAVLGPLDRGVGGSTTRVRDSCSVSSVGRPKHREIHVRAATGMVQGSPGCPGHCGTRSGPVRKMGGSDPADSRPASCQPNVALTWRLDCRGASPTRGMRRSRVERGAADAHGGGFVDRPVDRCRWTPASFESARACCGGHVFAWYREDGDRRQLAVAEEPKWEPWRAGRRCPRSAAARRDGQGRLYALWKRVWLS